jgi:3'(2'), 5'-bisphosphate nucleotidase
MNSISYLQYLAPCCDIARRAGDLIMTYYTGQFITSHKEDKSPVTDADIAANQLIVNALYTLCPDIPIIAEEDEIPGKEGHEWFWLVDPLDGTRSFVAGEGEFTVNIGLIHRDTPVLGVIYAPVQELLYYGASGQGSFCEDVGGHKTMLKTRAATKEGVVMVRSRSEPSERSLAFFKTLCIKATVPASSSMKFCTIAEGNADIYPRFGRTMEWDTAAGHAILNAAGGRVETTDGKPLTYGKAGYENPHFIAYGY